MSPTPGQLTTLRNLAVLFQRVEAPEALAELLGAVDNDDTATYGEEPDRLDNARAWASTTLGTAGFNELTASGANPQHHRRGQRRPRHIAGPIRTRDDEGA